MEPNGNDQPLMDVVLRFLQEEQWNFQPFKDKSVVRAGYRGERGTWVCYIRVDQPQRRVLLHVLMGLNVPPEYHAAVLVYLNRVNYGLTLGNFEMDLDSGDVRFRAAVETPDGPLTVGMLRALAYAAVRGMDYYFPGVLAVVHSGLSPEAALAKVEAQAVAVQY